MIKSRGISIKVSKIHLDVFIAIGLSLFYRPVTGSFDPIERAKQIASLAKESITLSYNLTQAYFLQQSPKLQKYKQAQHALICFLCDEGQFPPAGETYKKLNSDPKDPFLVSVGTSMSQTEITENIIHPTFLSKLLYKKAQIQKNPTTWLKDRWGYVIRSTSNITCKDCKQSSHLESIQQDDPLVNSILQNILHHETKNLVMSECPFCSSKNIVQEPKQYPTLNKEDQQALVQQLQHLGVFDQSATHSMPAYRISGELADILTKTGEIDTQKLKEQVTFAQKLDHPLYFFHHYANPQCKPHLFEKEEDIAWFANTCAEFIKACPGLTHVCPISQLIAFGLQVSRQKMLPPFSCNITKEQFLQNIVEAQVQASKEMKKVNPNLKVLVSHQWKPMKPVHTFGDPRHALETAICKIADQIYNQSFVQLMKDKQDSFDGIALSVYPALYFDLTTPQGNNCSGILDPEAALETIVKTHQAFPTKEIHIVETGCNSNDPAIKKKFVDMTLYVCQLAREMGIPVKSCYFWGHTNAPYFEWNKNPGTSFFGPFENLDVSSINDYGIYLQEILKQN